MKNRTVTLEERLSELRTALAALKQQPPGTPEQNFELDLRFYDLQTEINELEDQQAKPQTF